MTRYGILTSSASSMIYRDLVAEYPSNAAAIAAMDAVRSAQGGIAVTTCIDRGNGWECGLGMTPTEWLAQWTT